MDGELTAFINRLSGTALVDAAMMLVSAYGVPLIVALVTLQWFGRGNRAHIRHVAIVAGLAFLLGLALNQLVLLGIHRARPYDAGVTRLLIAKSADWSFPSDHATAAVAVAFAFLINGLRRRGLVLAGLAALVCLSRVYLGIHYVGDILGGAATAGVAVWVVGRLYREGNRVDRLLVKIL